MLKLSCHIDNQNKPVDQLDEGLKVSLEGEIEKRSEVLGRNAVFKKVSKINRLVRLLQLILIAIIFNYLICEILLEKGKYFIRN